MIENNVSENEKAIVSYRWKFGGSKKHFWYAVICHWNRFQFVIFFYFFFKWWVGTHPATKRGLLPDLLSVSTDTLSLGFGIGIRRAKNNIIAGVWNFFLSWTGFTGFFFSTKCLVSSFQPQPKCLIRFTVQAHYFLTKGSFTAVYSKCNSLSLSASLNSFIFNVYHIESHWFCQPLRC